MLKKAVFLSFASIALLGSASAELKTSYCDVGKCSKVKIKNNATVVVKSVTIIQQPTDGQCTKDERKISENLTRGFSHMIRVRDDCKYTVKFKTTSGCTGDKSAKLTPKKLQKAKDQVELTGACGSLKIKFDTRGPNTPV